MHVQKSQFPRLLLTVTSTFLRFLHQNSFPSVLKLLQTDQVKVSSGAGGGGDTDRGGHGGGCGEIDGRGKGSL